MLLDEWGHADPSKQILGPGRREPTIFFGWGEVCETFVMSSKNSTIFQQYAEQV